MYITIVPNRSSRPATLPRERYREGGKVRNRTLANLTHSPHFQARHHTAVAHHYSGRRVGGTRCRRGRALRGNDWLLARQERIDEIAELSAA